MSKRWVQSGTAHKATGEPPTDAVPKAPDPYVRWALLTDWRGYARAARWGQEDPGAGAATRTADPEMVTIVAHTTDPKFLATLGPNGSPPGAPWLQVPQEYRYCLPGTNHRPLYFTAQLSLADLGAKLLKSRLPLRWRLAMPRRMAQDPQAASAKGLFGPTCDEQVLLAPNRLREDLRNTNRPPSRESLDGALAVLDFGCPFLNFHFWRWAPGDTARRQPPLGTRVAALWDQGDGVSSSDPRGWHRPRGFDHGREMGPDSLNAATLAAHTGAGMDECVAYRSVDFLVDKADARRRVWYGTHGGHVLHMAGGAPDPLNTRTGTAAADTADDAAATAPLVFVQLPLPTALDSAGASLSAHVLDGVRYAMSLTRPGAPLVINISYGGQAGPHDGTSLLERALDDLLQHSAGNTAVVLAAGNSRQARAHARRTVSARRSALLRVAVSPQDTTDTFVEFWYQASKEQALEFRVRSPQTLWSDWVSAGQACRMNSDTSPPEPVAMLCHETHVPNGARAMALLAIAPTAQPPGLPCGLADAGTWQVEVRLKGAGSVALDAWIERDDPDHATRAASPFFLDQARDDDLDTLSSMASGRFTVRVGGFNRGTGDTAVYSSTGPTKPPGEGVPQVLAVCEEDSDNDTVAATATRSTESLRISGTSVAAPALARRLYNALAERHRCGEAPLDAEEMLALVQFLAHHDTEGVLKPGPG